MASRASLGTVAASVPPLVSKHLLTPFRGWLSAFCRSGLGVAWPVVGFRTEAPAWNCMVPSLIAACDVNCWQDRCHCLDLFGSKTLNSLAEAKHPCCWCLRQMGRSDNTAPIVLGRFIALAGTAAAGALCCRRFGKRQSLACRQDAKGAGRSGTPRGYTPKGAATQASWLLRTFRKNRKICFEIF